MRYNYARRTAVFAILAAVGTSSLVACSSGGDGKSQNAAGPGCDLSTVTAEVNKYLAVSHFQAPGPAFDAAKARGKTVFNIPLSSSDQFDNAITAASAKAAKAAGLRFVNWPNQGTPSEWVQGMDAAISQKAAAIILEGGPDPKLLGPQLARAKQAGIKVISAHLYDASRAANALKQAMTLSAVMPAHHDRAGALMANYAVKASACHVNALFVTADDVSASQGIEDTFVSTLKARCKACKATVVNVPITTWAQNIPTTVQSALIRDPTINWVIPVYAAGMQYVVSGVGQANATSRVKSVSYGGTAATNQMIENGTVIVAQVGESPEWNGWANIDQTLRVLSGVSPLADENVPHRIIDSSNVKETGTPSQEGAGFGPASQWENGYLGLWSGRG